jgi:hypothetical protein
MLLFSGISVTRALLSIIFWISRISNIAASTSGSAATWFRASPTMLGRMAAALAN